MDKQSVIDLMVEDYALSFPVQKSLLKLTVEELKRLERELRHAGNRIFKEGEEHERSNQQSRSSNQWPS
jgi:hypothetical protein